MSTSMREYTVQLDGRESLDQINLAIAAEEAGASQFRSSQISTVDGRTNIVTFSELPPGTVPKRLLLVREDDPQPPEMQRVWSGKMVVTGTPMSVVAYRSK